MDRLSLFKVLADRSRYAIWQELLGVAAPLSTQDLAERLELHPNTVRLHLEKMRDAGLVEVSPDRHGSVGRPQHRWNAVPQAPALGLEPAGFRLLAHLLAELSAGTALDADQVSAVGSRKGTERMANGSRSRAAAHRHQPRAACVKAVMDELAELGFDPNLDSSDLDGKSAAARISFTHCPFRELAVLYPDLVCQLHRGITEGILSGAAAEVNQPAARVESFASLVDADPCHVELSFTS